MEKVEIFVIGAEKAGTTYLAQMLSAQHFISGAKTKELHYFNEINGRGARNSNCKKPIAWYHSFFDKGSQMKLDATPVYLYENDALQRIKEYNPDAKIIISLREPVARFISHVEMAKAKGYLRDATLEKITYDSIYFSRGLYFNQTQAAIDIFGRRNCFITKFEHLIDDPEAALSKIAFFLGTKKSNSMKRLTKKMIDICLSQSLFSN